MRNLILTALSAGLLTCLPAAAYAAQPASGAPVVKAETLSKTVQHRHRDDRYDRRDRYDRYDRHNRYDRYDRRGRHHRYQDRSRRNIRGHDYRYGRDPHHRVAQPYPFHRARYRDCWRERQRGYFRNRHALVSVQVCTDRRGVRLVIRGSERLVRYYDRHDWYDRRRGYYR